MRGAYLVRGRGRGRVRGRSRVRARARVRVRVRSAMRGAHRAWMSSYGMREG